MGVSRFGLQFCITGVLGPGSNAHGPNEFLHLPTARKLTLCVAEVLAAHATRVSRSAEVGGPTRTPRHPSCTAGGTEVEMEETYPTPAERRRLGSVVGGGASVELLAGLAAVTLAILGLA